MAAAERTNLTTALLLLAGCVTLVISAVLPLAGTATPHPDDAVLVVTSPWGDAPETIVARAGGQAIGPSAAPLAILASGATAAAFKASGAFAVLPASSLALFCES